MLVLVRKPHEVIRIGTDIYLEVLSIKGKMVRLGFKAPQRVHILRGELIERKSGPPPRANSACHVVHDSTPVQRFESTCLPDWLEEVVG